MGSKTRAQPRRPRDQHLVHRDRFSRSPVATEATRSYLAHRDRISRSPPGGAGTHVMASAGKRRRTPRDGVEGHACKCSPRHRAWRRGTRRDVGRLCLGGRLECARPGNQDTLPWPADSRGRAQPGCGWYPVDLWCRTCRPLVSYGQGVMLSKTQPKRAFLCAPCQPASPATGFS